MKKPISNMTAGMIQVMSPPKLAMGGDESATTPCSRTIVFTMSLSLAPRAFMA